MASLLTLLQQHVQRAKACIDNTYFMVAISMRALLSMWIYGCVWPEHLKAQHFLLTLTFVFMITTRSASSLVNIRQFKPNWASFIYFCNAFASFNPAVLNLHRRVSVDLCLAVKLSPPPPTFSGKPTQKNKAIKWWDALLDRLSNTCVFLFFLIWWVEESDCPHCFLPLWSQIHIHLKMCAVTPCVSFKHLLTCNALEKI